jgi:cyclohexanone monooxygenase
MAFDSLSTSDPLPQHQIVIIGAGFSGLGAAIRLKQSGFTDYLILEKESEVGGTWYVNNYPGCACDIPSHVYSFSFEPNPNWSRTYSHQPEILDYLKGVADKHGLRRQIRFKVHVISAAWNEANQWWQVVYTDADAMRHYMQSCGLVPGSEIDRADPALPALHTLTTRVLISGMGGLSTPAFPAIKGLQNFQGVSFHSQQWRHDYDLTGKRVAVIGTGASAIQFVPQIQNKVARLDLYQRTPPWILPKMDGPISERKRWLYRHLPIIRWLTRVRLYWLQELSALAFVFKPELARTVKQQVLRRLERKITDPALRAKLMPSYELGCKRVLLSNDYLPALAQANVDVIDSGIREVRAHSIVDEQGFEREIDAIIFGTGFRTADLVPRGAIHGRDGLDLVDSWPQGPQAYKGTTIAGFPNLFMLLGPNVALGHNSVVFMIEAQINYVLGALREMRRRGLAVLEVRREAQDRYNDELQQRLQTTVWTSGGCRSYYMDPKSGRNFAIWPGFTFTFRGLTRHFDRAAYREQICSIAEAIPFRRQ